MSKEFGVVGLVDAVAFNQKIDSSSGLLWLLLKRLRFRKTSKKSGLYSRVVNRKRKRVRNFMKLPFANGEGELSRFERRCEINRVYLVWSKVTGS